MVKGGARARAGGPPPLNPSELFTGQLLPAKPAIPDSQQPRLPLKEIGREKGYSRKHRGGENQAVRQSDPPGGGYYGNSLTTWGP